MGDGSRKETESAPQSACKFSPPHSLPSVLALLLAISKKPKAGPFVDDTVDVGVEELRAGAVNVVAEPPEVCRGLPETPTLSLLTVEALGTAQPAAEQRPGLAGGFVEAPEE